MLLKYILVSFGNKHSLNLRHSFIIKSFFFFCLDDEATVVGTSPGAMANNLSQTPIDEAVVAASGAMQGEYQSNS